VKIVSLLPSATEIVFALGLGDQLEGVTYECDFPDQARTKPVVSGTALPKDRQTSPQEIDRLVSDFMRRHEPIYVLDRDRIQQVQPDLILAQDLCRVCAVPSGQVKDALAELGCSSEVLSLDPHTIEDILDCILAVGLATNTKAEAEELVQSLRARVDLVRSRAATLPTTRTLCLEWGDPPFVAGHWIPGMVAMAGSENVLNAPRSPSRRIDWDVIEDARPEVIVFMPCGYGLPEAEMQAKELFSEPRFAATPAARTGRVVAVDASSYFSRPGPRIVDGLEILAWAIHPEAFDEPPGGRAALVLP
jgi:iron complex transport system substrate-binding protein